MLFFYTGACSAPGDRTSTVDHEQWTVYKGDARSTSYSSLDQIDRSNVEHLDVAWTYETPDEPGPTIECNPIVVDGVMYLTSPKLKLIALDAATGEQLWVFDPFSDGDASGVNRGVVYWADGSDRRILFTAGPHLFALDATNGEQITSFGESGTVDLREDLDRPDSNDRVTASTPGIIYEDLLIMGSSVGEGPEHGAPGHIRAYDVRTGDREWIFHTIPHPGEFGYDTWPKEAWKDIGGANSWAGMSLDARRGIVYVPTGSATYDHFGGDRHGDNLFANTLLALEASTGERVWHQQLVHHDVWDYDLASPPTLASIEHAGEPTDVVTQPTKMGHLFVFDRETGEPIYPMEEQPVPQSELPGEQLSPTQPFPPQSLRYARQGFSKDDITDRTPEARAQVMEYFERYGPSPLFPAPSEQGDFVLPQFNGGTDWGGAAVDPGSGILYVNTSNVPELLTMVEASSSADHSHPYIDMGHQPIRDPDGYPVSKPPWGTLNAIDLNRGEILWEVPLGTHAELLEQGLPPTGTFNMGGPVATGGGLVFIGASKDAKIRAFDAESGDVLWEHQLPAGGYATPATYAVNGTQYVVIAAGGGGKPGTEPGNTYIAFALSEQ
jgi:quinoprotein glucose dehydrogenase